MGNEIHTTHGILGCCMRLEIEICTQNFVNKHYTELFSLCGYFF